MPYLLRYRGNGMFFCDEPYVVIVKNEGKRHETRTELGVWSAVERAEDATRYRSKRATVEAAQAQGLTGEQWEVVAC